MVALRIPSQPLRVGRGDAASLAARRLTAGVPEYSMGELPDRTAADAPSVAACSARPDSDRGEGARSNIAGPRRSRGADGDQNIYADSSYNIRANGDRHSCADGVA